MSYVFFAFLHLLAQVPNKRPSVSSGFEIYFLPWDMDNSVEVLSTSHMFFEFFILATWRRQWHPTPVLLPGKSHGLRSPVGCSPWGSWESDTNERLHFHFSLSCIGEGNGTPLQCSCLENPRDRGAWWAAVYGVAQSWTGLKRLSSSSSSILATYCGTQPCAWPVHSNWLNQLK